VLGFTKAVTLENARKNVTVNAIAPGYINTEMLEAVAGGSGEEHPRLYPLGRAWPACASAVAVAVAWGWRWRSNAESA
jgi:NAD(P)-dependent dehydrogenase (short-subunit alcohol dehydrogenase family)